MIYKGRFNQIEQGKVSNKDLKLLAYNLLKKDCVNFDIDNVGLGFDSALADNIIKHISEDKNVSILIINGITLELYNILKEKGYNNITLAFGNWNKEMQNYIDDSKETYEIMKEYIKNNFKGNVKVIRLKEIFGMKFDYIISNPPYAIGNEITKAIVDNVNFDTFVNLMPLSKYKKNKLYQNIESKVGRSSCADNSSSFDDAFTDPLICLLSKEKTSSYKDYTDFEIKVCYDERLSKFWEEQLRREETYLEHIYILGKKDFDKISSKTSFSCGIYTPHDKVHAINHLKEKYSKEDNVKNFIEQEDKKLSRDCSEEYLWNFIKPNCCVDKCFVPVASGNINQIFTIFKTEQEKDNFVNWWYSAERNNKNSKSGLASILLAGLNKPTGCPFPYAIPNVDWTHSWTDEEILRDYGYTEKEIKSILILGNNDLYRHSLEDF